ncbi:hypothetical protein [Hoylesella pleuritidis]|uniref:hypothetical protein n=1 Tax=Hoylesella pleuritidis TaxID=407975 RepID=UPI0028E9240F|nr:hypothetical protein [Hoylesella pleuritidis]
MSSYLHNDLYIICTNDTSFGGNFKKMQVDTERRPKRTVKCLPQKYTMLVEVDTKINSDFSCKTYWQSMSTGAFWGGLVGGVLGAICVIGAFIPGPGWLIAGICVGVAALAGAGIALLSSSPCKCNNILCNVRWQLSHPTVKFDQCKAITKKSFIQCTEGGTLLPFINETSAISASRWIAHLNKTGIALDTIVSGIGGGFFGYGLVTSFLPTIAFLPAGIAFGNYVMPILLEKQSDFIRSNSNNGGRIYQDINTNTKPKEDKSTITSKIENSSTLPLDTWAAGMFGSAIINSHLGGSNSAANRPFFAWMMKSKYSPYSDGFKGKRGRTGTNNTKRHTKALRGTLINIALATEPFLSNWINEKAREKACEKASGELTSNISIVSQTR